MAEFEVCCPLRRCPSHPGSVLDDIIPATGRTKTEIANLLGIPRQRFYEIVTEQKPVTPPIAARLGKLFGNGAAFWLRLQAAHDAWRAEREVDVSAVPTLFSAAGEVKPVE